MDPRSTIARSPPEAVTLAALFAGAALCLVVGIAFPMSDQAPVRLGAVLLVVAVALAAGTLALGARLPRGVLLGQACLATVLNGVLVAAAHTPAGAIGDAFAFFWLTAYVGVFFPRAVHPYAALMAASFGAGLLAGGLPGLFAPWAVASIASWMAGAVLARLSQVVRRHVGTDVLTGALNRAGLVSALPRTRRRSSDVAVAIVDLDGFKRVNDERGHAEGDRLLSEATSAWHGVLRAEDVLARVGGDEFVLVMPRTSPEQAEAVLDRLRAAHPVRWSAGVSSWRDGEPWEDCLRRADARLYAAKSALR